MSICQGTQGRPCRSGRGGGPARAAAGGLCGTCRRRKPQRHPSTARAAASAAVSAVAHHDSMLSDAQATLRLRQGRSERVTDEALHLVDELVDHLGSHAGLPGHDALRNWYDPPESDLSHAERRARRHAALLLVDALAENRVISSSTDAEEIVGPPVQRPEGFTVHQPAPMRPRTTIQQAQQVWSTALPASGSPVERWIRETRRAMPLQGTELPWSLRVLAPQHLREMAEELQRAQECPETADCIAVWAHQDLDGIIRCVSLESLQETDSGVTFTEPRWRREVGKRADSAMFFSPDGGPLIPESAETVYLVEGPVDALAVSSHHQSPAVACGGTGRPVEVAEIISRRSPRAAIICIADGDFAGREAMHQAAQQVPQVSEVIEMPEGIDPGGYFAFDPA